MKVMRILIILAFILAPLALFAGGSAETGSTTTTLYQGNEDPNVDDSNVTDTGETDSVNAGDQGMAQVPGTSGANQQFPGPVPDLSGAKESTTTTTEPNVVLETPDMTTGTAGTAETTTGALGAGKQGAVLKTIGNNEIRFSDISGYNFGTGKVRDLVLTQDGTVQYVVVNMNNAEGDFLVPPEMVSLTSANGGVTATFNLGAGGSGTMTQSQGGAGTQLGSGTAAPEATFASSLLKYEVVGSDNQKIGKVDDVVFDLQSGKVAYLAISQGGVLGIGKNLYAVSFDNAQLDPKNGSVMLNVSANDLKNAKGFDKANWPAQAEIGAQANLGAGAQSGAQSTTSTTSTMGSESTTSTTSTIAPTSSDTTTQPSNTPSPVNTPQGQEQSTGTK